MGRLLNDPAAARALEASLQNLEAVLGVQLVERTTRSLALTVIGQNFLPQARRLLADISSAMLGIREAGQASRGNVTLACVPTVGVQFLPAVIQCEEVTPVSWKGSGDIPAICRANGFLVADPSTASYAKGDLIPVLMK